MLDALRDALDGITVVALATNVPGPLAAAQLRSLGARVIKIEPLHGDALEKASPAWYDAIATGMEVLRLDLRDATALRALDAHLSGADVLLTAMRASSLLRLGFDWNSLHVKYPRLCHVAISGEVPPHDDRAGHDLTYQARAGTLAPPVMPRVLAADMAAAERAVVAVTAALFTRERRGETVRVDVGIVDAAMDFAAPARFGLTAGNGPLSGALPAYRLYAAKDGYVALAALEPHFVERLTAMLDGVPCEAAALEQIFATRAAGEWEQMAERYDVPLCAVRKAGEA